jgi:transcriptional regulator with XRE-family HTH domain
VTAAPNPEPRRVRHLGEEATPIAQRLVLGKSLRASREAMGISLKTAAQSISVSVPTMSRMETGQRRCKDGDLEHLMDLYLITNDRQRQSLRELDASANRRPWWQDWTDVAGKHLQTLVSFEEMAQRIRTYEPQFLPGLLQIEDYARAVIRLGLPEAPDEEVERRVALRLQRGKRFADSAPQKLICVIDETTLLRPYGSAEIMWRQVEHLLSLTENPRYIMRIAELGKLDVPAGFGPTTIFDFEERRLTDIVYSEYFEGAFILQEEQQVDMRKKAFDRLLGASLSHARSAQRLRDLLRKHY